uniref:Uncharacterized protein n=1 Tax=Coturnix japonica TaxID=93934 RepID=A0A8C2T616_COTJA
PVHKQEPLVIFCDTCDTLTCRDCQLNVHKDHQYQFLEDAVKNQRKALATLLKSLGDKHANLQQSTKEVCSWYVPPPPLWGAFIPVGIVPPSNPMGRLLPPHLPLGGSFPPHLLLGAAFTPHLPLGGALVNVYPLFVPPRQIHFQLQRALKMIVDPVEPQSDMKFQWDLNAWTKSAESFGETIIKGTGGGCPIDPCKMPHRLHGMGNGGLVGLPPHILTPFLFPPHSTQPSGSAVLRKVPRVSLERLDLDLSAESQPPVFRVFPGTSAEEFSLIVIERGGAQPQPAPPAPPPAIKEEQKELPIENTEDTKPLLLPPDPHVGVTIKGAEPPPMAPPDVVPAGTHRNVSCCRVCCQAGAVVMCDLCERCYHLDCHLPALLVVPSHDWRCLLCQDLPPPTEGLSNGGNEEGRPQTLSPTDQQKCERVLLELLCHEPFRPLHRLSSSTESSDAIDLTLIRAKLTGKLSPSYNSPDDFAADVVRMIQHGPDAPSAPGRTRDKQAPLLPDRPPPAYPSMESEGLVNGGRPSQCCEPSGGLRPTQWVRPRLGGEA